MTTGKLARSRKSRSFLTLMVADNLGSVGMVSTSTVAVFVDSSRIAEVRLTAAATSAKPGVSARTGGGGGKVSVGCRRAQGCPAGDEAHSKHQQAKQGTHSCVVRFHGLILAQSDPLQSDPLRSDPVRFNLARCHSLRNTASPSAPRSVSPLRCVRSCIRQPQSLIRRRRLPNASMRFRSPHQAAKRRVARGAYVG